jgi:hypothetical protein
MSRDDEDADYAPEADEAGELWCPKCGAVMYADAVRCPACEEYVTPGLPPSKRSPLWIRIGAALLLLALVAALFASCFG